jgi:16S rRNA processing protein RimM
VCGISSAGTRTSAAGKGAAAAGPARPVVLAVITRAHGLKGELAIHRFNPSSENLTPGGWVWLEGRSVKGRWARVKTSSGDRIGLEDVSDRSQAEALQGAELSIERSSLPEAAPGEFYLHDLVGFRVRDAAGREIGTLTGLQASGTKEYFVIKGADDVWLPANAPIVAAVDLEAATLHLNVEIDSEVGPQHKAPTKG